jgi:hypothetical protein
MAVVFMGIGVVLVFRGEVLEGGECELDEVGRGFRVLEDGAGEAGFEHALDFVDRRFRQPGTAGDIAPRDLAWRRGLTGFLVLL